MLGYILSKINLLILVISMFAIVAFFAIGLGDIAKINEANLVLRQIASMGESIANSNSSCDSASYYLPESLNTGGGDFYYVMKISKLKLTNSDGSQSSNVIFSVLPRIKQDYVFSANSFRTNAEVFIYSKEYVNRKYEGDYVSNPPCTDSAAESCAVADPQAEYRVNTVVFIKERLPDKDLLHIIPCNVQFCDADVWSIGNKVRTGGFLCGTKQP